MLRFGQSEEFHNKQREEGGGGVGEGGREGGGRGALYLVFIRSKVDRRLRVICKHKTLNQANVGAKLLISPKCQIQF